MSVCMYVRLHLLCLHLCPCVCEFGICKKHLHTENVKVTEILSVVASCLTSQDQAM